MSERAEIVAASRAFLALALKEPLGVDISDYGDGWFAGFLKGQENALAFVELVLDGAVEGLPETPLAKAWLAVLGADTGEGPDNE